MSLSIELPLARMLVDRLGRARALEIIPRLADSDEARDEARMAVGSKIEIYDDEQVPGGHIVQSVFALVEPTQTEPGHQLDDGVYWDNLSVVVRGRVLPEAAVAICPGRPITAVVDHPYVAGILITDAENSGAEAVVLEADAAMMPVDQLEQVL